MNIALWINLFEDGGTIGICALTKDIGGLINRSEGVDKLIGDHFGAG